MRHLLIPWIPKFNRLSAIRKMYCTKEVIPQAQRDAEVDSILDIGRQIFGMMPAMHLRVVEQIFEWPQWNPDIGVIEVTYTQCNDMHHKKFLYTETDHP